MMEWPDQNRPVVSSFQQRGSLFIYLSMMMGEKFDADQELAAQFVQKY